MVGLGLTLLIKRNSMSILHRSLLALVCMLGIQMTWAAEEAPRYNQIHYQVERSRPVDNDRMHATLNVSAEDGNAARLADQINRSMDWALKTAKAYSKVQSRTASYQTHPVYDKDKIQRWRATQELLLEGADFAQLGELIGKLQERLQVAGLTFSVSPERRATVEDELITKALDAFKQRAELVRKQLGAKSYRIVTVSINQDGAVPIPRPMLRAKSTLGTTSVTAPAVEAGTSTLSVIVSGSIELQ